MKKQFSAAAKTLLLSSVIYCSISGCKKDESFIQSNQLTSATDVSNIKADIIVHPGESIQAAVDAASPGATIQIEPGTYSESITVNKASIKIVGSEKNGATVIIQNPGSAENGISVGDAGDGFTLQSVTVKNFEENGVLLDSVDNFTISKVTATDNGEYGIFPVHCSHGVIDHCTSSGHSDTGIYVGQSSNVNMQFNVATANVTGLEVENSSDINVTNNQSYNNVCGVLVDLLPGKDIKTSSNVYVANNHVYQNNHINFGEEGSIESFIPSGLGILVLGTDATTVEKNNVHDNDFAGISVFSTLVLAVLANIPLDQFADIEPNADAAHINKNTVQQNGKNPPVLVIPLPGVDLLWDGSGVNNCWSANKYKTTYPAPLPACN